MLNRLQLGGSRTLPFPYNQYKRFLSRLIQVGAAENAFTAKSSELNFCPGSSHRKAVSPIVPATPMMLILLSR